MLNDIMDKIKEMGVIPDDVFEQFMQIMTLPDDQFKAAKNILNTAVADVFNSREFEDQVISSAKQYLALNGNNVDFAEERKTIDDFIDEIRTDDSIIKEKRDFLINLIMPAVTKAYEYLEVPRPRVEVEIELTSAAARLPEYAHNTDAGADVFAAEDVTLAAGETKIISTGIKVAIPIGYEIQVRPRSGLSAKTGLRVANAPGTIDSSFRGIVGVIMTNIGDHEEVIKAGDKIAQLVVSEVPMIKWKETIIKNDTDRGEGGFGSTGN